ncbi:MAG: hypothetical protein N2578_03880 [Bdellovibrionaceae bacterium]|nr:hypothetical protein [Pseudobdellovibrionaceae bacterium]
MKTGYDRFFVKAREVEKRKAGALRPRESDIEAALRRKLNMPVTKAARKKTPWLIVLLSVVGLALASYGIVKIDEVEKLLSRIEVRFMATASAEESNKVEPKPQDSPKSSSEVASNLNGTDSIDHLARLAARKKELDAREEELKRVEEELNRQKEELDKRMRELASIRSDVSNMLQERVKKDDERIDTLVQMYSSMKPSNAAKVFESMDEDLVVEILGRMKKKNAAEIMNLLKPEKAQVISEKYAGYGKNK